MGTDRKYGKIEGLTGRIGDWLHRVKYDKSTPWAGLGLCADLEVILRLLSLEEFGQWLRSHSDDELQRWGIEVLDAADAVADLDAMQDEIVKRMGGDDTTEPYLNIVERVANERDDVRKVLIECGALAPDDTDTNVPDLLRALLA
jgi:hypothetical protein